MIRWPAVIQYAGQAELAYVADAASWQQQAGHRYRRDDRLIDADGRCYRLDQRAQDQAQPQAEAEPLTLAQATALLRAHTAQQGECCSAKLHATSIAQAWQATASAD